MEIKTKYSIDQYVWIIGDGALVRDCIKGIYIDVLSKNGPPSIKYSINGVKDQLFEYKIFESKEALIQSL